MALLKMLKDMNIEEILAIAGPILYLIPIMIIAVIVFIIITLIKRAAVSMMFSYMNSTGIDEKSKREYLANYLTRTSTNDLINHKRNCPVCGRKYSLKIKEYNSRGDVVEKWNHNGCTFCNTKVVMLPEVDNVKYFAIERTPTTGKDESKYSETFDKLSELIEYYKPYVDCTPDPSGDNISVDISFK